jgi:hypothetical protein
MTGVRRGAREDVEFASPVQDDVETGGACGSGSGDYFAGAALFFRAVVYGAWRAGGGDCVGLSARDGVFRGLHGYG